MSYPGAGDGSGGPGPMIQGSYIDPATGLRRSARLNPEVATVESAIDDIVDSPEGRKEAETFFKAAKAAKGGRRQRGGELTDILRLYGILDIEGVKEKVEALKIVAVAAIFNGKKMAEAGWTGSEAQRKAAAKFFIENYGPLYTTGGRFLEILVNLADQLIVKVPVTTVMLTTAAAGYTINFFSWVFAQYNELGRAAAADLLKDERAKSAAAAAVGSAKEALKTVGVVAFVANQLGLLPVSAVLAAILWQLQATLGTGGGRAYLVSGFYAWYQGQDARTQAAINTAAKNYAAVAQSSAISAVKKKGPGVKAAVTSAAGESAGALGALLAKAGRAGKNAFQAVGNAVTGAGGKVVAAPAAEADATAALVNGAPAAALAAEQADAGAAAAPALAAVGPEDEDGDDGAASAARIGSTKRRRDEEDGAAAAVGPGAMGDGEAPAAPKRKALTAPAAPDAPPRRSKLNPRSKAYAAPGAPAASGDGAASGDAMQTGQGRRRKTKKAKSKRRVTRRRKAQKILGTPVFIY